LLAAMKARVVLALANPAESTALDQVPGLLGDSPPPGRCSLDDRHESQLWHPSAPDLEPVGALAAPALPQFPARVWFGDICSPGQPSSRAPIAIRELDGTPAHVSLGPPTWCAAGPPRSGRTTTLAIVAAALAEEGGVGTILYRGNAGGAAVFRSALRASLTSMRVGTQVGTSTAGVARRCAPRLVILADDQAAAAVLETAASEVTANGELASPDAASPELANACQPKILVIDDATERSAALQRLVVDAASTKDGRWTILAGIDSLRGDRYGELVQSFAVQGRGALLQPDLERDGPLLTTQLPIEVWEDMSVPGRGFLVERGRGAELVQFASPHPA
jgi:hypothetical protein